ncbi:hypothetical protein ACLEIY_17255 [Acetobacter tropicalis]|uniref:FecR family protein n=1 Tax=Acetobacter tropicalis TaxID=104102 RepID=UPI00397500A1
MYSTTSQTDGQRRKEDAAHWVALTDARALLPDEQKQLDDWLQADTRNLGAFVQAKSIYHALDYRSGRHIAAAPVPAPSPPLARRHFLTAACAAGVAALVAPKAITEHFSLRHRGRQAPQRYEWHGNQITVDARSGAYFSSTQHHDAILIADGRIGLQIQRHPLHVTVGTMWLGSKKADFDISVQGSDVIVALYSGALNWKSPDKSLKFTSPNILLFSQDSKSSPVLVSKKTLPDDDAFARKAWRNGQIIMNNYTLTEAVNEFNRYSDVQCLIASPTLAQRRLSGSFSLLKLHDFAQAAALLLNCKIRQEKNTILFYS